MVECFPEFATVFDDAYGAEDGKEQLGVLMRGLKDMVAQHFNAGIPVRTRFGRNVLLGDG